MTARSSAACRIISTVRAALKSGSATRISGMATATRTRSWLYRLRNGLPVGIVRPLSIGAPLHGTRRDGCPLRATRYCRSFEIGSMVSARWPVKIVNFDPGLTLGGALMAADDQEFAEPF